MDKINLQMFADAIGFSTQGSRLQYQSGSTWTTVAGVRTIPQQGGAPNLLDVTDLLSVREQNIFGLEPSEVLDFDVVYKGANFDDIHRLAGQQTNFRIVYTDGLVSNFRGEARVSVNQADTNAPMAFTIHIAVSEGPDFEIGGNAITGASLSAKFEVTE